MTTPLQTADAPQTAVEHMLDFEPVNTGRVQVHTADLGTANCPATGALLRCDGHVLAYTEDTTSGVLVLYFSPDHPPADPYAAALLGALRGHAAARGYREENLHDSVLALMGESDWAQ